jgi:hypothetical protein
MNDKNTKNRRRMVERIQDNRNTDILEDLAGLVCVVAIITLLFML